MIGDHIERLNYNQLYYFYVVATEGSIKAACEKLHLTQPTISGQLKTLEEDLGHDLFDRKYRKLEVNKYGREILKKAEKIFVLGDELLATMPHEEHHHRNDMRIGVVSSLPNSLVHDFTYSFWSNSTLAAHLTHGGLSELISMLNEDKIDLILSDTPYGPSDKYKTINLGSHRLMAVGSQRFEHANEGFPQSLSGLPYLSFNKGGQIQEEIDFFFKINNIKPDLIGSVDDANFIRSVTLRGFCFSILPEMSVKRLLKNQKLFLLGEMNQLVSNCWVIVSSLGSKRISVRKVINDFMMQKKRL